MEVDDCSAWTVTARAVARETRGDKQHAFGDLEIVNYVLDQAAR